MGDGKVKSNGYETNDRRLMFFNERNSASPLFRQHSFTSGVPCRKRCTVRLEDARYTIGTNIAEYGIFSLGLTLIVNSFCSKVHVHTHCWLGEKIKPLWNFAHLCLFYVYYLFRLCVQTETKSVLNLRKIKSSKSVRSTLNTAFYLNNIYLECSFVFIRLSFDDKFDLTYDVF